MKVFVTGATGFVGRHTIDALLTAGHQVVALIRRQTPHQDLIDRGVVCIYGDLSGTLETPLPSDVDVVIHIAGLIKARYKEDFYRVNVSGTQWICEQFKGKPLKKFILISSIAARGPNESATSYHSAGPVSHYGKSKRLAEDAASLFDQPLTIIRPPIVYGPSDRETLLFFKMFQKGRVWTPGYFERKNSFIYVKDLAALLANPLQLEQGVYHPDDGKVGGYTWNEVAGFASQSLQRPVKVSQLPLTMAYMAALASEGVSSLLGRLPILNRDKYNEMKCPGWFFEGRGLGERIQVTPLSDGFLQTYQWYRQHGWL